MDARIEQITSELDQIANDAQNLFGDLSDDKLNTRPADGGWSIAECLEHLILSNKLYFADFDRVTDGSRKNTLFERYSPFSSIWGNFLVKALRNDKQKTKTIAAAIPSNTTDKVIREPVARFVAAQNELIAHANAMNAVDWQKTKLTSPFLSIATYSLFDAFRIIIEHEKRHIRQAQRVLSINDPG